MKIKSKVTSLLGEPSDLFEKFHRITYLTKDNAFNLKIINKFKVKFHHKSYARFEEYKLPKVKMNIWNRRNTKLIKNYKISKQRISILLKGMYDFISVSTITSPFEIYLISLKTELNRGLYHYYPENNSLELLPFFKFNDLTGIFPQNLKAKPSFYIVLTLHLNYFKSNIKEREYKNGLIEIGMITSSLFIISDILQIRAIICNNYYDEKLNKILGLHDFKESAIQTIAFY